MLMDPLNLVAVVEGRLQKYLTKPATSPDHKCITFIDSVIEQIYPLLFEGGMVDFSLVYILKYHSWYLICSPVLLVDEVQI